MKTVIPFLGFCVILAGTKSVKESHHPAYRAVVSDPSIHVAAVEEHRERRQVEPSPQSTSSAGTTLTTTSTTTTTTTRPTSTVSQELTTQGFNTSIQYDEDHTYYTSKVYGGDKSIWVNLRDMGKNTHDSLSDSHRTAASIELSFTFPFYGHPVKKVTIATGGFLYMSEFLHQWLTATQYIAPLMANFDSSIGNESNIHYADNGTMFAVWWEGIHLQDQESAGPFSFQALLHIDGTIIFNYQKISVKVDNISAEQHPVKVGLSDAYYYDRMLTTDIRRRTIYEYHRVEISRDKVVADATVIMKPLPTCGLFKECVSCIQANIDFTCQWCTKLGRCSDGLDRHRQDWLEADCLNKELTHAGECPTPSPPRIVTDSNGDPVTDDEGRVQTHPPQSDKFIDDGGKKTGVPGLGTGGVIAILLVLFLIVLITSGFIYAYLHPQSKAGIWLIEHRPSNLRAKLNQVKFWKHRESGADKYEVSMGADGESTA